MQIVDISLAVVVVVLVYRLGKIYIRRLRRSGLHIHHLTYWMVVGNLRALRTDNNRISIVRVVLLRDGQPAIIGQRQQRHQFEGRARLYAAREGVVLLLVIYATLGRRLAKIHHRQNIARLDIHHHRRAPRRLLCGELLTQGSIGGVLYIYINGGDDILTILRLDILLAMYGGREAGGDALAQHTAIAATQIVGIDILQTILSAGALLILLAHIVRNAAQRAATQLAIGIYSLVEDMFLEGDAHISVQDGVLAQYLPLVEVHRTRQNLHGVVVTHGGIDLENLHIVTTQVIDNPREEVAAAPYQRVVRIYPLAVLLALLKHQAAVVGSRAVLEEGGKQLRERIDILAEGLLVVETLATHIEVDAVAQDGCGQRLAIACEDGATARDNGVGLEDALLQTVGILGRLGDGQHNPRQTHHNGQTHEDENPIYGPHSCVHLAFDIYLNLLLCHFFCFFAILIHHSLCGSS